MRQRSAIFWRFLLIKNTLKPNLIVEIIIKATGFCFFEKIPKTTSIFFKISEKNKIKGVQVLCGICLLFCSPAQSFVVPCNPLQFSAVLCCLLRHLVRPTITLSVFLYGFSMLQC